MRMNANYGGIKARLSKENLDEPLEVEVPAVADPAPEGEEVPATDAPTEGETIPDATDDVPVEGEAAPVTADGEVLPTVDTEGNPIEVPAEDPAADDVATIAGLDDSGDPVELPVTDGEPPVDGDVSVDGVPEGDTVPDVAEDDAAPIGGDGVDPDAPIVPEGADGEEVPPVEGDAVTPEPAADGEPVVETPPEGATDATPDLEEPAAEVPSDAAAIVAAADTLVVDGDVATDGGATLSEDGEIDNGDMSEGEAFTFDDPELGGEELPPAADIPPAQLGESADSIEADMVDVTETAAEVDDMNKEIETKAEVVDELEAVVESMRIAIGCGGVDNVGGIFLKNHVDSLYKRAGIPVNANSIATESFGDAANRVGNNTYAMETIKETARNLWDGLIQLIQKGIQFIKDQFRQFFDAAAKLKARAEGLARQAAAVKGEAKEKTFKNDKLASTLHINGKMPNAAQSAKDLAQDAGLYLKAHVQVGIDYARGVVSGLNQGNLSALENMRPVKDGQATDAAQVGVADPGEGMLVLRHRPLPGNRAVIQVQPDDNTGDPELLAKMYTKLATYDTSLQVPGDLDIPVLSVQDAAIVALTVKRIADQVLAFKSKFQEIDKLKSDIISVAKKQAAKANDPSNAPATSENPRMSEQTARSMARAAARMVDQPAQSLMPYLLNTGVSFLNLVELSMKQYAVQAPAAKPAPAKAA